MNLRSVATQSASRNCPKPAPLSCAILRTPATPAKNLLKAVEALAIQLLRPGWASVEDYLVGMVGVLDEIQGLRVERHVRLQRSCRWCPSLVERRLYSCGYR